MAVEEGKDPLGDLNKLAGDLNIYGFQIKSKPKTLEPNSTDVADDEPKIEADDSSDRKAVAVNQTLEDAKALLKRIREGASEDEEPIDSSDDEKVEAPKMETPEPEPVPVVVEEPDETNEPEPEVSETDTEPVPVVVEEPEETNEPEIKKTGRDGQRVIEEAEQLNRKKKNQANKKIIRIIAKLALDIAKNAKRKKPKNLINVGDIARQLSEQEKQSDLTFGGFEEVEAPKQEMPEPEPVPVVVEEPDEANEPEPEPVVVEEPDEANEPEPEPVVVEEPDEANEPEPEPEPEVVEEPNETNEPEPEPEPVPVVVEEPDEANELEPEPVPEVVEEPDKTNEPDHEEPEPEPVPRQEEQEEEEIGIGNLNVYDEFKNGSQRKSGLSKFGELLSRKMKKNSEKIKFRKIESSKPPKMEAKLDPEYLAEVHKLFNEEKYDELKKLFFDEMSKQADNEDLYDALQKAYRQASIVINSLDKKRT